MDRPRSVERGPAAPQCPRAGLLLARGEERDEVEHLEQPARDLADRRRAAVSEGGGLFLRQLRELRLELRVDAAGAVLDREQRLRRQHLELRRQLARPIRQRAAGVEMCEQRLQLGHLRPQRRIAGFRLLRHAFEPSLDVIAIRDEQLELQRLEIGRRLARARPAVQHGEQRVDLPEVPEQRRARAGHVDDANRGRRDLLRRDDARELIEALVRDRRHPDMLLPDARRLGMRQRTEQSRRPCIGQADDSHLHGHPLSLLDLLL